MVVARRGCWLWRLSSRVPCSISIGVAVAEGRGKKRGSRHTYVLQVAAGPPVWDCGGVRILVSKPPGAREAVGSEARSCGVSSQPSCSIVQSFVDPRFRYVASVSARL